MSVFDPRPEHAPEEVRPPSPRRVAAGAVPPVLALQATVGNRAVTSLLQRDDKPAASGGPVPNSPLVDARVDGWINPKYTEYLKRYDNNIQGQPYSVVIRDRKVWKNFANNREADVDVHYLRRRSLTKSEPDHIKVTVVGAWLEPGKWQLTATLFDWTDGFNTQWSWEATLVQIAGTFPWSDPTGYSITEIPPPAPPPLRRDEPFGDSDKLV
jgi:hypothetical protein